MQYGIAIWNVCIRTEPVPEPLRKEKGDVWDRRQESRLNIGEAVQIKCFGQNWVYVISDTTSGYAKEEGFVLCSRAQYECYRLNCKREHRVVLRAGRNEYGQYLRVGTVLPLESAIAALGAEVREQMKSRVRKEYRRRLYEQWEQMERLPVLVYGKLPFSERQILLQMERMLDIPYSWGDERVDGMDCSSTVRAFYTCFGLPLPRNSGEQKQYGERLAAAGMADFFDMQGMPAAKKRELLCRLSVGAVLHMSGHVMLYAGERDGAPLIFHNCDTYTVDGEERIIRKCVVTELLPKGEGTYLDYLTAAWEIKEIANKGRAEERKL